MAEHDAAAARKRLSRDADSEPGVLDWLPAFCDASTLLSLMVMTELLVLAIMVGTHSGQWWREFAPASAFALWLTFVCSAGLCVLRRPLARLPFVLALGLVLLTVGSLTAAGTWLLAWLDASLGWELLQQDGSAAPLITRNVALALLLTGGALRYLYLHRRWQQTARAEARAELAALQARIRPHFLFNSLNTIAALIPNRPVQAEQATEALSDLLRAVTRDSGGRLSNLAEELELLRGYLELEALRLGERLQVHWQLDVPEPKRVAVPALMLQPLVENAVVHGIAACPRGGELSIAVWQELDCIHIEVRNPLPTSKRRQRGDHLGTALDNIRARLRNVWGERAGMSVAREADYYRARLWFPASETAGSS